MGVDVSIQLPGNARVSDVIKVIGIAAGLKPRWGGDHDAKWVEVPGTEIKTTMMPEMVQLSLFGSLIDGEERHFTFYHFESSRGGRSLHPRSTAFWIAIAHRLVDFFGGQIDYQDCDDVRVDYSKCRKLNRHNCPSDGKHWDRFQERLFNVLPITKEELLACDEVAAYKMSEMKGGE